jgi:hypothetical protein
MDQVTQSQVIGKKIKPHHQQDHILKKNQRTQPLILRLEQEIQDLVGGGPVGGDGR